MAVAKATTKLSLDAFARVLQINPLHFNSVTLPGANPTCGEPIYQYGWQAADKVSREEIANVIADAERLIENHIHYRLLPSYEVDERHTLDPRMWQPRFHTDWGYVQSGGQRSKTAIAAASPITWGSVDNVGYKRTGTITVSTTVTNVDELAVYYPGHQGDDGWQIRDVTAVIAAGVATITIKREQTVLEDLLETFGEISTVDGQDDANFLGTVDVGRVYLDPTAPMAFLWNDGCLCGCEVCVHATQGGCLTVIDQRQGMVVAQPATYGDGIWTHAMYNPCRLPDSARLWYRAGYAYNPLNYNVMDPEWERAIAYLAMSMLDRPLCGCNSMERASVYWSEDLSMVTASSHFQARFMDNMNNPLGTTRGAMHAWRLILNQGLGQAVAIA